eukprot:GFUD01039808.1.p1 GENE.GFUD01039808.1~~GFUD01039808.1.p1  ORF type:complete len:174 (+),score=68.66 GFUD01039808.1:82-603(+)
MSLVLFYKKLGDKKKEVLEAFRRADKNRDGRISMEEIAQIFKANDVHCTPEEIQSIFSALDKDGTGLLDIKEFSATNNTMLMVGEAERSAAPKSPSTQRRGAQQPPPPPDKRDKAEMAFKLYDKDKDGYITKGEMVKLSKTLTKEQVEKAFSKFDSDGDGRLSYEEFKKMMHK